MFINLVKLLSCLVTYLQTSFIRLRRHTCSSTTFFCKSLTRLSWSSYCGLRVTSSVLLRTSTVFPVWARSSSSLVFKRSRAISACKYLKGELPKQESLDIKNTKSHLKKYLQNNINEWLTSKAFSAMFVFSSIAECKARDSFSFSSWRSRFWLKRAFSCKCWKDFYKYDQDLIYRKIIKILMTTYLALSKYFPEFCTKVT